MKGLCKRFTCFVFAALLSLSMVGIMPQDVSAADLSLKGSGKTTVTITDEQCYYMTGELTYLKIKPKSDGYLKLKFSNASSSYTYALGKVWLCNKSKTKQLSTSYTYNTNYTDASYYTECYGLKKNTVYYVAVQAYDGVKISADFKKVSDKSGSKKSKAKTIKKGKTVTGILTAGKTTADWYKFKLSSRQKLKVYFTPCATDTVKISFSGAGIKSSTENYNTNYWGRKIPLSTRDKVRTGNYYIKVQPATKSCTGYYKLSWK